MGVRLRQIALVGQDIDWSVGAPARLRSATQAALC